MSSGRDSILRHVRTALAPLPHRADLPDWEPDLRRVRRRREPADLVAEFCANLTAVHGTPLQSGAELTALLAKHEVKRGYCDPELLGLIGGALAGMEVETAFDRQRIEHYEFGITRVSAAIAETGTLILCDRDNPSRLAALAPWVHVGVLRRRDLHPDIPSALAGMPADPNVIWVTGPSKTADVEGILIEGVHGPGVQAVLLVD